MGGKFCHFCARGWWFWLQSQSTDLSALSSLAVSLKRWSPLSRSNHLDSIKRCQCGAVKFEHFTHISFLNKLIEPAHGRLKRLVLWTKTSWFEQSNWMNKAFCLWMNKHFFFFNKPSSFWNNWTDCAISLNHGQTKEIKHIVLEWTEASCLWANEAYSLWTNWLNKAFHSWINYSFCWWTNLFMNELSKRIILFLDKLNNWSSLFVNDLERTMCLVCESTKRIRHLILEWTGTSCLWMN